MASMTWMDNFDGGFVYAPWSNFEGTVAWYKDHFGLPSTFDEKYPNEQMTSLSLPDGGKMHVKSVRPDSGHFQVDWGRNGPTRFCFEAPNVERTHRQFLESGLKVTELNEDPYGFTSFDVSDLNGTRLTIQSPHPDFLETAMRVPDARVASMAPPRYAVPNLTDGLEWYKEVLGIREMEIKRDSGVTLVQFGAIDDCPSILEESKNAQFENTHQGARPYFVIRDRKKFHAFHSYLRDKEISVSNMAGHEHGLQLFHFFDPYGNQINVWVYPC